MAAIEKSGLEPRKFFNVSGKSYREKELKDLAGGLGAEEVARLINQDPMLLKRPLVLDGERVLVGFSEEAFSQLI